MIIVLPISGVRIKPNRIAYQTENNVLTDLSVPSNVDLKHASTHSWLVKKKREGIDPSYGTFKLAENQPWWEFKVGSLPLPEMVIEVYVEPNNRTHRTQEEVVKEFGAFYRCSCSPDCLTLLAGKEIIPCTVGLKWRYVLPMNKFFGERVQCSKPTSDDWQFLF